MRVSELELQDAAAGLLESSSSGALLRQQTDSRGTGASNDIETSPSAGLFRQVAGRFVKHRLAVIGLVVTSLLIVIGILAPLLTPHSPYAVTASFSAAPSGDHWLGTDQVGRDVLSRLIAASRVSLIVGFSTVGLYITFGTLVGLISAYVGGWLDMIVMRVTDMFMAFPFLMVILVVVSALGASLNTIIIVLALFSWPAVARLVRSSILSLKQLDYIKAGRALGYSAPRIWFRHLLPNALGPIIVNATFGIASAIMSEAGLSFLGMGVQPPAASWGNMLSDAQSLTVLTDQPWLWVPAGTMLLITVLAINFVGDGLRDALDPKR
ncbi:peptide/nickel transport system permease protein [Paenibacillus cellulosilyticus]|uniref:Peptide/nickel transport system permease protein n=1 Tax=Paenibacillus cellulosilyticus TaxID=375489 RepID=A0A2V2Z3M0_9BACL|nr:oligopeptide ABC transporter permease [Paenibacillus cellulosilyticus]PWW04823.1 peptide/nickel transport system permease protein [Paenibacillus cellulosilyticus]QKS45941.1 ABC transporter permease [Paenibacillus cellulosilyticus]